MHITAYLNKYHMRELSNMQSEFPQFTLNLTAKIYKILYSNNFLTLIVIFIRPSDGSVIVSNINFHAFLFFVQCQIFFFFFSKIDI